MASVGKKRSLSVEDVGGASDTSDRPQKKIARTDDVARASPKAIASQDRSTQSSHREHSVSVSLTSSTQPTSQEPSSQTSPLPENTGNGVKLPRILKRPTEEEAPRPRKRPGAGARIDKARSDAILEKRKREEEEETRKITQSRGGDEFVKQHYNLVPQRGRDWRNTESKIKGLRKYNNWVKSVIINRFSLPDDKNAPPLKVLDMGCGKGGDLQKWQSTPHPVALYVGIDPAEVSIDQARDRYAEMRRGGGRGGRGGRGGWRGGRQQAPLFDAEFVAKDAFGQPVGNIPVVQHVGFDPAGTSRWGGGGFDVVSMMFCMHYAFESEAKTRGMLTNVAGSLKKGGKFIGVIPNSDVIRSQVERFHALTRKEHSKSPSQAPQRESLETDPRKSLQSGDSHPQSPEHPEDLQSSRPKGVTLDQAKEDGFLRSPPLNVQDGAQLNGNAAKVKPSSDANYVEAQGLENAEWGNEIYRVRFPGQTPEDGIFRPPFGWKYNYFLEEAVEEVPEFVVPWEAFRA